MERNSKKIIKVMIWYLITGIFFYMLNPGRLHCQEQFPLDPGPCYGTGGCEPYVSPKTWTGIADNDWYNPSNWSGGEVPGPIDDVLAPSGTSRTPKISGGRPIVKSLTVKSGNKLEIDADGALTVTDGAVNRGKIILYSSRLLATAGSSGSFISPGRILCD